MLDSLVRVSRRVGGATDLLVTEMQPVPVETLAIRDRSGTCQLRSPGSKAPASRSKPKLHLRLRCDASSSSREVLEKCSHQSKPTTTQSPCGSLTQQPPTWQPEPPTQTSRNPSVYHYTVSRTVELSLQSSFQLSLTVLVRYRSRGHI